MISFIKVQDGTQVQIKSVTLEKYVCAESGGGTDLSVTRDVASSWETFTVRCLPNFFLFNLISANGSCMISRFTFRSHFFEHIKYIATPCEYNYILFSAAEIQCVVLV